LICRGCGGNDLQSLLDLGRSPIANQFLTSPDEEDPTFPLHVMVCMKCAFVQLDAEAERKKVFSNEYVYLSSYSKSWLLHSENYYRMIARRLSLDSDSLVVEIASNDGYLLKFFNEDGIPVLGVEPVNTIAEFAQKMLGIETIPEFFGTELAKVIASKYPKPNLIIANNVLAHVPNIHDFIEGFSILMSETTIATFEFPHVSNLIKEKQFDTIYHEHYSYLGLTPLVPIFAKHGLHIIDVEKLPTHGGSLRVFVSKKESRYEISSSLAKILMEEKLNDVRNPVSINKFASDVVQIKDEFIMAIKEIKSKGKSIAAYGAAAKGNTFLNYTGIGKEYIDYVVDLNPTKQGKYLPGTKIPVVGEEYLKNTQPDVILILPWNIDHEIVKQLDYLRASGTLFVRAVPTFSYL